MDKIILSTKRLKLRTWKTIDINPMAQINANPKIMEYFPSTQNLDETKQFIDVCTDRYKKYGFTFFPVELKNNSKFIGFVGLNVPGFKIPNFKSDSKLIVEIGWRIDSNYWNQGYATEAATEVIKFSFDTLQLLELISFTTTKNLPSRRVMEKIGLTYSENNDFDHPNLDSSSPLKKHALYKISRSEYSRLHTSQNL